MKNNTTTRMVLKKLRSSACKHYPEGNLDDIHDSLKVAVDRLQHDPLNVIIEKLVNMYKKDAKVYFNNEPVEVKHLKKYIEEETYGGELYRVAVSAVIAEYLLENIDLNDLFDRVSQEVYEMTPEDIKEYEENRL